MARDLHKLFAYMTTASRRALSDMQLIHAGRVSDEKRQLRELMEDLAFDAAAEMSAALLREHGEELIAGTLQVESVNINQLRLRFPDEQDDFEPRSVGHATHTAFDL